MLLKSRSINPSLQCWQLAKPQPAFKPKAAIKPDLVYRCVDKISWTKSASNSLFQAADAELAIVATQPGLFPKLVVDHVVFVIVVMAVETPCSDRSRVRQVDPAIDAAVAVGTEQIEIVQDLPNFIFLELEVTATNTVYIGRDCQATCTT